MDTCNQLVKGGKVLEVNASIEYLSENKEYNRVGWFLLIMFDNWGKVNDEFRVLFIFFF